MAKIDEIKDMVKKEITVLRAKNEINVTKRIDKVIEFLEDVVKEIENPDTKFDLNVTAGSHTTLAITLDGQSVTAGKDKLPQGSSLVVTASASAGYKLTTFTINGVPATSGDTIIVGEDISIVTEATAAYDLTITSTNATVVAKVGNTTVTAGEEVLLSGQKLKITATVEEGYELTTLTANGTTIESGDEITVSGDVTIIATGTLIPEEPVE